MKVTIKHFKKIASVEIELGAVNVFIGANNSGKSSFIQGIQFAISSGQTLQIKRAIWARGHHRTLALDSTDYLYTPTRHIENLYHGQKLTGSKGGSKKQIKFIFHDNGVDSGVDISKGRNGGFTTTQWGKPLGEKLSSVNNPFCVYVPGIAGIPVEERYEVPIAIKKSATRGDSNNYFRNILWHIFKDKIKWNRFITSISNVYGPTIIKPKFDEDTSEFISVEVVNGGFSLPIDSVGTGLLQAIQVFAYIEYFNPRLILLDEPDAHIHPTKQKLLANELFKRTEEDADLKIVFSTHSRYILDALEDRAKVFHFQNGIAIPDVEGSKILLDIGAADADYLFSKKQLKWIVVTEDRVDNIEEKKEFLKKFLLANGLNENEFVLHSYESCTQVNFAKILRNFVAKQIPGINVIVHMDRDQRADDDMDFINLRANCKRLGMKLFLTKFSEIENYYCQPVHLSERYGISMEDAEELYRQKVSELETETKHKVFNFLVRYRINKTLNEKGHFDKKVVDLKVEELYNLIKEKLTPGKELLGKLKDHAQNTLKKNPNDILAQSPGLIDPDFQSLLKEDESD